MRIILLLAGALVIAPPLLAQNEPTPRIPTAADSALLRAIRLPEMMQKARAAGAPDSSLRAMVDLMRRRGIPAGAATEAVEIEADAVEAGGDKDNFGAFVRAQVESGVRGQELAAKIRAERAARGMGPPAGRGRPDKTGPPAGRGKSAADTSRGKARPPQARRP